MQLAPRLRPVAALAAGTLLLAACGAGEDDPTADATTPVEASAPAAEPADSLTVVATTTVLGDLVKGVAGDDAVVTVLMEPGQDPHGFAPSAQDAQALREADLVVANGFQLEEGLLDALEAAEEDGVEVLEVAPLVDPLAFAEGEDDHDDEHGHEDDEDHGHEGEEDSHEGEDDHAHDEDKDGHEGEDEHGHDHGEFDPHFWHDPARAATAAREIAEHLAEADDELDDQVWLDRGDAFAAELEALDEDITATLSSVPEDCRKLVTNHDAFGYFAAAYDFQVVGSVIPGTSTQVDPSAQDFAELAELIRDEGVPAIFAETQSSTRLAEALAEEVGREIAVVELFAGTLGAPGSGADTYLGMLEVNAQRIADALGTC